MITYANFSLIKAPIEYLMCSLTSKARNGRGLCFIGKGKEIQSLMDKSQNIDYSWLPKGSQLNKKFDCIVITYREFNKCSIHFLLNTYIIVTDGDVWV